MLNKELIRKIIVGTFISIPFLSSLISTFHIIRLFSLGNQEWMSIILALAFELGSIASLLVLSILDKVNKSMVMSMFVVLVFFQILGNVYFSFNYINQHLLIDPKWLGSFQELVSYFVAGDQTLMKLVVSLLVGGIIPLISLFSLKSLVDYLKFDDKQIENKIVNDTSNNLNIYDTEKIDKEVNLPELEIINDSEENNSLPINATVYSK